MPMPADWAMVPVTGTFVNTNGTPVVGTITFTPSNPVSIDGVLVAPGKITVKLNSRGEIPEGFVLPATNDPDTTPHNWTYKVTENWKGGRKAYNMVVPFDATSLDMADVVPVIIVPPYYTPGTGGGSTIPGPQGPKGDTGAMGATGATGLSAYQIAVNNGFVGTQTQWLASLKGEKGDKGDPGTGGGTGGGDVSYEADGSLRAVMPDPEIEWHPDTLVNITTMYEMTDGLRSDLVPRSSEPNIIYGTNEFTGGREWTFPDLGAALSPYVTGGTGGEPGADGKSAYQIAQDNGFVGTESQWLASLQGAPGADGADGADGSDGAPGAKGDKGDKGDTGNTGADGRSAYTVAVANGYVGTEVQWLASLKGAKGDKGDPGNDGTDGAQGIPGKDAYEVAVDEGFVGTRAEWLLALADGDPLSGGWRIANLSTPPLVWFDFDNIDTADKVTMTGNSMLAASIVSQFNAGITGAITGGLIQSQNALLGNRRTLHLIGPSAARINLTGANSLFKNKAGHTQIILMRIYPEQNGLLGDYGYTQNPYIYVGTPNANGARYSLGQNATSPGTVRQGGRRNDADTFDGNDWLGNMSGHPMLLIAFWNHTTQVQELWMNGTRVGQDTTFLTAGLSANTDSLHIGIGAFAPTQGGNPNFEVACFGMHDTVYNTADRQLIEGYLMWRHRIQKYLPADHPYKAAPPQV